MFSAAGLKPQPLPKSDQEWKETHPIYECVAALRVVLSRLERPQNWAVVEGMATHRQERMMMMMATHR